MADANLYWGGDLAASPTGDLATSVGDVLGQQRVLRRLLTNPSDYIWHPDYGAGLGRFVGGVASGRIVEGTIRSQLYTEATVSHGPDPSVGVDALADGSLYANIVYVDAQSLVTQTLTFTVDY